MLGLILDSLGSTELLFILVIALMFFGPRKLPQISRSIGKSLAEFRKASEDFKRTWEREVALESARPQDEMNSGAHSDDHTIMNDGQAREIVPEPPVAPIPAERVIARQSSSDTREFTDDQIDLPESGNDVVSPQRLSKRDWL